MNRNWIVNGRVWNVWCFILCRFFYFPHHTEIQDTTAIYSTVLLTRASLGACYKANTGETLQPRTQVGYGVLVCLRREQPNTLRLTSRAFRGINRRCRYTFIAGQGKKKKPEPNTFSSIRFRLLLVHRKEYCRFPTFGCEPRQGAACGWHSSIRACGATQLDSA